MKTAIAVLIGMAVGAWSVAFATAAPDTSAGVHIHWTCILGGGCFAYRDDTGETIAVHELREMIKKPGVRP